MNHKRKNGSTLVEVLVAIVVLGILSAVVMSVSASVIRLSDTSNKQFFAQRWVLNVYEQFKAAGFDLNALPAQDPDPEVQSSGRIKSWWTDSSLSEIYLEGQDPVSADGQPLTGPLSALKRQFDRTWNPVHTEGYYTLTCSVREEQDESGLLHQYFTAVVTEGETSLYTWEIPFSEPLEVTP